MEKKVQFWQEKFPLQYKGKTVEFCSTKLLKSHRKRGEENVT